MCRASWASVFADPAASGLDLSWGIARPVREQATCARPRRATARWQDDIPPSCTRSVETDRGRTAVSGRTSCSARLWLLLRPLGLPLLLQCLLRRLLLHALLRVLVLGRHALTSLVGAGETLSRGPGCRSHSGGSWDRFTRVAARLAASWRFHLRRPRPRSVRGLRGS